MLDFVFVVSWLTTLTTSVCCLNFTLSKTRVIVGNTGKLFMTCSITEKDASVVYDVQIWRETNSGWQTMALIEAGVTEVPALNKDIVDDKDFVVGGILDKENPLNTHLTLEMNIEKMTYDDARVYRCQMTYKSKLSRSIVTINRNATLLIVVSGLNFTLSKTRVIAGTTGKLFMTCDVTATDASAVYNVQIRREACTGWETLAYIEAGVTKAPVLNSYIVNDKDFVVGGLMDKNNPLNTHLTLEMNIEKMTYDDARVYRCQMTYKSKLSGSTVTINRNATLLIVEANDLMEGRADTKQDSEFVSKNHSLTVVVTLGVAIILITIYASYITVKMRRIRDRNRLRERCEMLNATPTDDTHEVQNSSDEV